MSQVINNTIKSQAETVESLQATVVSPGTTLSLIKNGKLKATTRGVMGIIDLQWFTMKAYFTSVDSLYLLNILESEKDHTMQFSHFKGISRGLNG